MNWPEETKDWRISEARIEVFNLGLNQRLPRVVSRVKEVSGRAQGSNLGDLRVLWRGLAMAVSGGTALPGSHL